MADKSDTTLAALLELEKRLPDGTSMAQINIKMGDSSADWYATHGVAGYAGLVSDLSSRFNANCRLCKGQAGLIHRLCNPKQLFLRQDDSDY
jgi:hypothetical protein